MSLQMLTQIQLEEVRNANSRIDRRISRSKDEESEIQRRASEIEAKLIDLNLQNRRANLLLLGVGETWTEFSCTKCFITLGETRDMTCEDSEEEDRFACNVCGETR